MARRRRGMSGGKKMLLTFVLAAAAFAYQYVRSPSFRRQCGSVFAEWRGPGHSHTPSPRRGTPPVSGGEFKGGGKWDNTSSVSGGELKRGGKWDNLDLGVPGKCDQVIEREGYALGYVNLMGTRPRETVVKRRFACSKAPQSALWTLKPESLRGHALKSLFIFWRLASVM